MDTVSKKILNSLKCPVCGGQIDGVKTLYCAADQEHYYANIDDEALPIFIIIKEIVKIYSEKYQFEIIQEKDSTAIYIWNIDKERRRIINKPNPPKPIVFNKKIFNLSVYNNKLINKIKTILVFQ
jgi:hypothetical protein